MWCSRGSSLLRDRAAASRLFDLLQVQQLTPHVTERRTRTTIREEHIMNTSIHADTKDAVRIGARRFEQSPFYAHYVNPDTVLGVVAGRYMVANGEDPLTTYWTLRRQVVLYDVPEKPWRSKAPSAVAFFSGARTAIRRPPDGTWALCDRLRAQRRHVHGRHPLQAR